MASSRGPAGSVKPTVVATLATAGALQDLQTLLFSLALFNGDAAPKVYLFCDSAIDALIPTFKYPGRIVARAALNPYAGKGRAEMERTAGREFASQWFDFMCEKIRLLEWAFEEEGATGRKNGILFCDADICFLAPLPAIPAGATLALSPHMIRAQDESRFGRYNGGFFWLSDPAHLAMWRKACQNSRFYEQSALEDVAAALSVAVSSPEKLYEFPITQNYGWWRLWQAAGGADAARAAWSFGRNKMPAAAGVLIGGEPLGSVHTHFWETRDQATMEFNSWIKTWLGSLAHAGHAPAKRLLGWLNGGGSAGAQTPSKKSKIE